jgi:hypothetical protein
VNGVRTALLALALGACSGRNVEEQKSAGLVARAIEQLRNAPNQDKPPALAELRKVACVGKPTCEVHAACVHAYTEHVAALELTQAAKANAREGKTPQAAKLLIDAQEKLSAAEPLVGDCTQREAALRRQYKL